MGSSVEGYDPRDYPPVAVTVDVVLFAIDLDELHVLLVRRGIEPFIGQLALPGGFVRKDEDLKAAATRELLEETSVSDEEIFLDQLGSYGEPGRDPRMRVVTVAYWGACRDKPRTSASTDAAEAEFVGLNEINEGEVKLAFDHHVIVNDALTRLQAKLEYTNVAAEFCPKEFTITDLRRVYEVIWDARLDPGNFQRKVRENVPFRPLGKLVPPPYSREVRRPIKPPEPPASASNLDHVGQSLNRAAELRVPGDATTREPDGSAPSARMPSAPADAPTERIVRRSTGRPASLWTVEERGATLNSPIPRPKPRRY